jgi:formiminoglutamase
MLQNWLKPLAAPLLKETDKLPEWAWGKQALLHRPDALPDLKKVKVALLGVGDAAANAVRSQLHAMTFGQPVGSVADLGNLRKAEPGVLIPVLYELMAGKVLPLLIGAKDELLKAQFLAYQETKALVNAACVDQRLQVGHHDSAYAPLFAPKRHPMLFHFSLIGLQMHQSEPDVLRFLQKNNFDALRLGRSRSNMEDLEPVIRDADMLAFHMGALRQSDAPGASNASVSGFFVEEACQICRYAGMSDKLTSFGIYGLQPEKDRDNQTATAAAQMAWYFLDGFANRVKDYPVSTQGMTEYIVDFRKMNYQLTFWKSAKSGRWWMQVPVATKRKHDRHRLIPCSFQDYQSACREELPDRLMQAMSRF